MAITTPTQELLTAEGVADICKLGLRTLWRLHGLGALPAPIDMSTTGEGRKLLRWRRSDIDLWVELGCPERTIFESEREARARR